MGFYSDPSIFDGAHAAVRQTEASKEAGTDAQMGSAVGKTGNRRPDGKCRGGKLGTDAQMGSAVEKTG